MATRHPIIGSVRGRGLLLGIELVTDRETMQPNVKAGHIAYVEGWRRGIAWSTYDHILRMAPPIVMSEEHLTRGLKVVEESIAVAGKELGV
jgi:4-aminobutyrate aminotransferase-like enzyme